MLDKDNDDGWDCPNHLLHQLLYPNRDYVADVQMEMDYDEDPENLPHTYSPPFNPFKQSECCCLRPYKQPQLLPHPKQLEPLWSEVTDRLNPFNQSFY